MDLQKDCASFFNILSNKKLLNHNDDLSVSAPCHFYGIQFIPWQYSLSILEKDLDKGLSFLN